MKNLGEGIAGTVGKLTIKPNSNQFVPDFVEALIEIRTFDTKTTNPQEIKEKLLNELSVIQGKLELELSWRKWLELTTVILQIQVLWIKVMLRR